MAQHHRVYEPVRYVLYVGDDDFSTPERREVMLLEASEKIRQRFHEVHHIAPSSMCVLWVPEKCSANLFAAPNCESLAPTRGRYDSKERVSVLVDSMERENENRLHLLCGCEITSDMDEVVFDLEVTVWGYTHQRDIALQSGEMIHRNSRSGLTPQSTEEANRVLQGLQYFRRDLGDVFRELLEDDPSLASLEAEVEEIFSFDEYAFEEESRSHSRSVSTGAVTPSNSIDLTVTSTVQHLDEDANPAFEVADTDDIIESFVLPSNEGATQTSPWIYLHGEGVPAEMGAAETCTVTSELLTLRLQKHLSVLRKISMGDKRAARYCRHWMRYEGVPEIMSIDRTIVFLIALTTCHNLEWSDMFIEAEADLCAGLFESIQDPQERLAVLKRNNLDQLRRSVTPSGRESLVDKIRESCRARLEETVFLLREKTRVDLDTETSGLIQDSSGLPSLIAEIFSGVWEYLGTEV